MCQGCIHTGAGTKGRTQPIVCRVKQQQAHRAHLDPYTFIVVCSVVILLTQKPRTFFRNFFRNWAIKCLVSLTYWRTCLLLKLLVLQSNQRKKSKPNEKKVGGEVASKPDLLKIGEIIRNYTQLCKLQIPIV